MNDKVKNIVVTIVFVFSLVFFLVLSLLIQDEELSYSERRKLAQFPQITFKDIKDATFMNKLDTYVVDQFPFREEFRSIKERYLSLGRDKRLKTQCYKQGFFKWDKCVV